jgi:chorismate synthase
MNSSGTILRYSLFGESHGPATGVVIDGLPAGIPLAAADFATDLARRRAGASGTTPRVEADEPEILSGLFNGHSCGSPLCIIFRNGDTRSTDYAAFADMPRPGHADFSGRAKYRGYNDPRGSGHFSGRITVGVVAAGVVAKKLLPGVIFETRILSAGGASDVSAAVQAALDDGDSVGALVEIRVRGLPPGLGEPFFGSVEGELARAIFAIPAVRGLEFGDGFAAAGMRGSAHNDPFIDTAGHTARNGAGGINGGITNGNELVMRIAVKPTSTIAKAQQTLDFSTGTLRELAGKGRHDACIALRSAVVLEAACAAVLADLTLLARSSQPATAPDQLTRSSQPDTAPDQPPRSSQPDTAPDQPPRSNQLATAPKMPTSSGPTYTEPKETI